METIAERPAGTEQSDDSALDHSIDPRRIPAEWFPWAGALLVMLVIRLIGRTNWPLSPDESEIAYGAWLLVQGADLPATANAHPFMVQATGLLFFLFGETDYTARLIPLLAGVGILTTLFWLRHWIGNLPALATAVVWTLSPVMTMSTLRLDGGAVLAMAGLIVLGTVFVMSVQPGGGKAIALGIALAISITAHPLGWLVALFTLVPAILLIRRPRLGGYYGHLAASFLLTFLLIVTWFFSSPSGLLSYFPESLGALWDQHLATLGNEWPLTVLLLIVDEPLMTALAILGLVAAFIRPSWPTSAHPALIISSAAWAVPLLTLGIILDGKGPAVYAATLFPLTMVAGMGLSVVIDGILGIQSRRIHVAAWALVTCGLVLAIVRLADGLLTGADSDGAARIVSAVVLAVFIILPLGYAAYRLTPDLSRHLLPAVLAIVIVLLSIVALRTSLMLTSTDEDRTGEVLLAGSATPAVDELQRRVARYSRDVTMYSRDAGDPTGGHGLVLAFDETARAPFEWYFREFPDREIVTSPEDLPGDEEADMIFVGAANQEAFLDTVDTYQSRIYPTRFALAEDGANPTYVDLLAATANPLEYGGLLEFIVHRDRVALLDYQATTVMVRDEHIDSFWGGLVE